MHYDSDVAAYWGSAKYQQEVMEKEVPLWPEQVRNGQENCAADFEVFEEPWKFHIEWELYHF